MLKGFKLVKFALSIKKLIHLALLMHCFCVFKKKRLLVSIQESKEIFTSYGITQSIKQFYNKAECNFSGFFLQSELGSCLVLLIYLCKRYKLPLNSRISQIT